MRFSGAALGSAAGGTLSPATDGPAWFVLTVLLPAALLGAALLLGCLMYFSG